MSSKRSKRQWHPRGAQKWVLAELRALGAGARLSTAQLATRIAKASGKTFHKNSVYNALRILVRKGAISAQRDGHEKLYRASENGPSVPPPTSAARTPLSRAVPVAPMSELSTTATHLPHKLALGEVLVLSFGNGELVTATNVYGKIVIERHEIPG